MRPLNLGETLDASIKVVRRRWRTLALVMLVVAVPIQIATVVLIRATTDTYQAGTGFAAAGSTKTAYGNEAVYVAGQTAILALSFLGFLLGTVACYRAVADTYLGRPTSARASLAYAGDRLGATLWLSIVLFVGLMGGFIALVVPGIWLAVAWSVAFPVMLVEGAGGVGALRRSFSLVRGRWWATCGRVVVASLLVAVIASILGALSVALPTGLGVDDTSLAALLLEHLGDLAASLVTTPFLAAVTTLVYFDLRGRKEGFDPGGGPSGPAPDAGPPDVGPGTVSTPPPPSPAGWAPPQAPTPRLPPSRDT